jgi:hypothetical protein
MDRHAETRTSKVPIPDPIDPIHSSFSSLPLAALVQPAASWDPITIPAIMWQICKITTHSLYECCRATLAEMGCEANGPC